MLKVWGDELMIMIIISLTNIYNDQYYIESNRLNTYKTNLSKSI